MPPPCLWIGAGETITSASSPRDCWKKNSPTFSPAARRSAHTRRPLTSRALCSQKSGRRSSSDHQPFDTMPCSAGARPVRSDACATQVTAGNTLGAEWNRSPAISSIPLRSSSR